MATRSAGPTVLSRVPQEKLKQLMQGYGYRPFFLEEAETTAATHLAMAKLMDELIDASA